MKKNHSLLALLFLGLFIMPLSSTAVEVSNLFEASVDVSTQRESERKIAMAQGFSQVLLRVSGNEHVLQDPSIIDALNNSQRYVVGFSYARPQTRGKINRGNGAVFKYSLNLKFDERAITLLLRKAELPVWGKDRPPLMVWWVFDDGERQIVNAESARDLQEILSRQASLRGVPLIFPLLDLQDNANIEVRDIWGFFFDTVKEASLRYGSQNILVGRTFIQGVQSVSRWVLLSENETYWGEKQVGKIIDILPESMDFAADNLAERYSIASNSGSSELLPIVIYGVNDLHQFAELERFFQKLDILESATLTSVEQDRVVFDLSLRTELERLKKAIVKSRKFSEEPLLEGETGMLLRYRLVKY
ncbi:MAG: DUF2066 domain-containing protein [Pseudomonadales bacterium]|nr:DUF2066 domain-containing protein [Pseudomonadales bacterium]